VFLAPFKHHRPAELNAVFDLLAKHGDEAAVYAGGTELLLALKARVLRYEHLVDLKRVGEFAGIKAEGGEVVIGALATHHEIANSEIVQQHVPAYAALSDGIANIRVRSAGTLAGNLSFSEPHSDPPSLLAAMGASVTLVSPEGRRSVPVAEFIVGEFTTVRNEDELIAEIRIPFTQQGAGFRYLKFGHLERPAVGASAGCVTRDGRTSYRLWLGAIGDHPIHVREVEEVIEGVPVSSLPDVLPGLVTDFASKISATSDLHGSADYKQHLAGVLLQRALAAAAASASGERQSHA